MISLSVQLISENRLSEATGLIKELNSLVGKVADISGAKFVELVFPFPYVSPIVHTVWIIGGVESEIYKEISEAKRLLERGNITIYLQVDTLSYLKFTETLAESLKEYKDYKIVVTDLISDENLLNPED
jgi:hypothetical protein